MSHRNTGAATGCPLAEQLLARIATDENLHMVFYRNLVAAALDRAPDADDVRDPRRGRRLPDARRRACPASPRNSVTIAKAGIYDLRLHHDEVIAPVLRFWKVFTRDDLGPEGEQAREELAAFMTELDAQATRFVEKRDKQRAGAPPAERGWLLAPGVLAALDVPDQHDDQADGDRPAARTSPSGCSASR